ncbi:MAG: prepilin-type N-terminal cleavage/methylation domain-containing protein, partial [Planctomycetes bacterium]|nr:prepilin-type N-terminal cleavage/methylation domain-containing protein [Planctomycetota bacterium]
MSKHTTYMPRRRGGFTLIELLVVVAIIALLISILLPSLNAARRNARAVTCGTNLRHVGTSVALYLADNASIFPASYIYANGPGGKYDLNDQPLDKRYGYLHWSYFLYQDGKVSDKAFTCPEFRLGGVPRTNPGSEGAHWEAAQVDDTGGGSPGSRQDFQAPFMAFTANAAIMPRNKF